MDEFLKDQIINSIKYIPSNIIKSYFKKDNGEAKAIREKVGFVRGVCHPTEDFKQLTEANINWVRTDLPYPFDENGSLRKEYIDFKEKCKRYRDRSINVMAVTGVPAQYIKYGADIRTAEGESKLREVSRFIIGDIQGLVSGLQISNEMGMPRFTVPLNMSEAVRFIGVQMQEMYPLRKDIIIGYNSAGPQVDLHYGLKPYHKYCDYVGLDMYLGCFFSLPGFMWIFDVMARYLWAFTDKPILMQEFGYISAGKPKSKAEKKAILQSYGFSSEREAKQDIARFVDNLPEHFSNHVKYVCEHNEELYKDFMFSGDMTNHLYLELPAVTVIPGYPHTPEGQAKFFKKVLPMFHKLNFICGAIVFAYTDCEKCAYCGQTECPTETRWGLVDVNGNPKPSYYAVQEAYANIKKSEEG